MVIGDIFYYDVAYDDNPSKYKNCPVIIIDEDDTNMLLLITTTTKPRQHPINPHSRDYYKIPIPNWRKTGLREPSWCRGKRLISVPRKDFEITVTLEDYIGRMEYDDFNFIIERLEELHRN